MVNALKTRLEGNAVAHLFWGQYIDRALLLLLHSQMIALEQNTNTYFILNVYIRGCSQIMSPAIKGGGELDKVGEGQANADIGWQRGRGVWKILKSLNKCLKIAKRVD